MEPSLLELNYCFILLDSVKNFFKVASFCSSILAFGFLANCLTTGGTCSFGEVLYMEFEGI